MAQQPAWYHAQAKVALLIGLKLLQQFVIWELWRQVWQRVSKTLFWNQLFSFSRHSDDDDNAADDDSGKNDNGEYWIMSHLPLWMQRSIDFGDATIRRGTKKWLQKSVEKTVETNVISWFVWIKDAMTLSLVM